MAAEGACAGGRETSSLLVGFARVPGSASFSLVQQPIAQAVVFVAVFVRKL
jgi:hypothetical protein